MGAYTTIKHPTTTKCCGRINFDWQSKRLTVEVGGQVYKVEHCLKSYVLQENHTGEMHGWCAKCQKMTQYEIKDGRLDEGKLGREP